MRGTVVERLKVEEKNCENQEKQGKVKTGINMRGH